MLEQPLRASRKFLLNPEGTLRVRHLYSVGVWGYFCERLQEGCKGFFWGCTGVPDSRVLQNAFRFRVQGSGYLVVRHPKP